MGIMHKKNYFLLAEIFLMMALTSACSAGPKAEARPKSPQSAVFGKESVLPVTGPLEMLFYSGAGAWGSMLTLNPDGSFEGEYFDENYYDKDMIQVYVCQYHGQFGSIEELTDASWRLTLEELELDTGRSVGESWEDTDDGYTIHYIASEPGGFCGKDQVALPPGAQFLLYSPEAAGHEPGTELYGAVEFLFWENTHQEFTSKEDVLGCWGLRNLATEEGFFTEKSER